MIRKITVLFYAFGVHAAHQEMKILGKPLRIEICCDVSIGRPRDCRHDSMRCYKRQIWDHDDCFLSVTTGLPQRLLRHHDVILKDVRTRNFSVSNELRAVIVHATFHNVSF